MDCLIKEEEKELQNCLEELKGLEGSSSEKVVIQTIIINLVEIYFVLICISLFLNIMLMILNKSILLLSDIW